MHVDDLADACLFLMKNYSDTKFLNLGSGIEHSIKNLALLIKRLINFNGEVIFDSTKPDGTPRKLMDVSMTLSMGWSFKIDLENGLRSVIQDFNHKFGK
jgi:GDP-L-fucose synthase